MRPTVAEPEDIQDIVDTGNTENTEDSEHGMGATRPAKRQAHGAGASGRSTLSARIAVLWHAGVWLPIAVLAAVTATTAIVSETLVGTIEPLTDQVGLNPFFVGLIILPIVGNAAEHFTAITSAAHNHMEIAMAITAGSSIQIALLATPVLVFAGALIGAPLDLNFSLLEVAIFGFVAGLYALISLDGESTWLEGVLLCAFYLILAVGTFFAPA
jgi:Ca2+:H+ antiporter